MTALDDARAARAKFDNAEMKWDDSPVVLRNALDALIAEHERLTAPPTDDEREALGRRVREVWVEWAQEQAEPKPSWLVPWDELGPADREVDMRIGEALAGFRRQGPITDAQVEAASVAMYRAGAGRYANMVAIGRWMRVALEAARDAS
jgi:hypothetical protein